MSDAQGPRRLLFISNGYGEDSIAAAIVRNLPRGFIAEAYPTRPDGITLFPFRRLFIVARRA